MKRCFIFVFAIVFVSCSNSELVKHLETSDNLVIQFKQRGSDSTFKKVVTTENHAIQTMIQFADGDHIQAGNCISDGDILFYKNGELVENISFNFSVDGCHQFLHAVKGKTVATKMSNEAEDFLIALANQSR